MKTDERKRGLVLFAQLVTATGRQVAVSSDKAAVYASPFQTGCKAMYIHTYLYNI